MPLTKKNFFIRESYWVEGGPDNDSSASHLHYNDLGEFIELTGFNKLTPEDIEAGYKYGLQSSNMKKIMELLQKLIAAEDKNNEAKALALQERLERSFIYDEPPIETIAEKTTDNQAHTICEYHIGYVRPTLEALLVDHLDKAISLLNQLTDKDDDKLYKAFEKSLAKTDFSPDKSELFKWDSAQQEQVNKALWEMGNYSQELMAKKKGSKSNQAGQLMQGVVSTLKGKMQSAPVGEPKSNKEKFAILKFKLDFLQTLHQHDKVFNAHKGWRKIAAAIVVALLSLTRRPSYYHYKKTGEVPFFRKTKPSVLVSAVDDQVGLVKKQENGKPSARRR